MMPFSVDIGIRSRLSRVGLVALLNPPKPVFFYFVRHFVPILCITSVLNVWCCSDTYAQLADGRSRQTQNNRETRTTQTTNPAQVMMQEMQDSLKKLPWNELSPATQTKIKHVASGSPLFRRFPQQSVYADPEIYTFLLRHPDMVIGFWEHWGATQLSLREVREDCYLLKETTGTSATVEVLYRTQDVCIVYAKGEYRGPLITKAYPGEVILILRTQLTRDSMNEPMIICDLDALVQINSLGADVLAKMFFTSLAKIADSNFEVTVYFVSQVSKAASHNAAALKGSAEEILSIRQEIFSDFCDVVDRVAMRFARRNQPTPLASKPRELPRGNADVFLSQSQAPEDWGMNHFYDSSQPFREEMSYENAAELSAPKSIEANHSKNTVRYAVPKLPMPEK